MMIKKINYDYIDALRGYAVLLVIFTHVGKMFALNYPPYIKDLIEFGTRGVQLFFIISAFTLFLSAERRFRNDSRPYLAFFIRRFFRIAPLYYLGIIIYSVMDLNSSAVTPGNILRNVFFVHNIFPDYQLVPGGWSISSEMLFYLIVPFLFTRVKNLNSSVMFSLISLSIALFSKVVFDQFTFGLVPEVAMWLNFPYFITFSIPVFGIGISFYYIIFKNDTKVNPYCLLLILALIFIGTIFESGVLYMYIQAMGFGMVTLILSKYHIKIITNRLILYFGKISFSMYLLHFLAIRFVEYCGILKAIPVAGDYGMIFYLGIKFLITLVITTFLATITYHLVEVPGQKLGKSLIRLSEKSPVLRSSV